MIEIRELVIKAEVKKSTKPAKKTNRSKHNPRDTALEKLLENLQER